MFQLTHARRRNSPARQQCSNVAGDSGYNWGGRSQGTTATHSSSPSTAAQGATCLIVGDSTGGHVRNPPAQGPRVDRRTEVAASVRHVISGEAASGSARIGQHPARYLPLGSGTLPSIQGPWLYGIVVVTASPNTAYTGVAYGADVPLEFSEIDPVQNKSVQAAVTTSGFSETAIRVLRDSVSSVTVNVDANGNPMGGTKYAVNEVVTITGGGYSTQATAHVSSVDPTTGAITGVSVDNAGAGYTSIPSLVTVNTVAGSGAQLTANLTLAAGSPCSDEVAA